MCSLVLRSCFLTFSVFLNIVSFLHAFDSLDSLPSMQREALPDVAVKPDVEAEPKDQLRQFGCASNKLISIAKSIPKSLKFCGSL